MGLVRTGRTARSLSKETCSDLISGPKKTVFQDIKGCYKVPGSSHREG